MFETRTFRLKSPLPETSLFLRQLSGSETLGVIGGYDLIALSPSANLPLDQLVGHPVTIEIDLPKGGVRHVHQYVAHMALAGEEGQYYRYEAELRPWLWFLTRTADWKVFQKINTLDIVKQVFADHGIAKFEDRTTQSYPPRRYCVQAGETDASFVMRLLEQEGIYFYFDHSAGAHTLILCDNLAAHRPRGGYAVLPFEHGGLDGGMHIDQEHFAWWRCGKSVESGRVIVNDYDYFRPSADLKVNITDSRPHGQAHHDVYLWHSEYYDEGRGRHFAEMRLQAADAGYQTALGSGPIHGLGSGLLFSLIDHPRTDQNREYLIVREDLRLQENKYETTGSGQGTLEAHLQVLPSSTPYRPPRHTPKPYLAGVQTAVVVGPPGEEIWCDEKGRVKVQFHWDRYGPKTDKSSCWIRVSSQWAGQGFGQTSIPRIGQEVLVQYIEGDPDRPVIIGRVYNDERRTPFGEVMTKTQSGLYSRSSPGGGPSNANIFRFEDKMGEEEVYVQAEKDMNTLVKHNETRTVKVDRTLITGGTHTETIGGNTTLVTTGPAGEGGGTPGDILVQSQQGQITLEAATQILLKVGGSTITMTPDHIVLISPRIDLNP